MEGTITVNTEGKIATVSFFNPASNAFPSKQLQELSDTFYELKKNSSITTIILRSEGEGAFCAGASFDELLAINNYEEGNRFFSGFANVINAMRKSNKIIIGRVHGKAVGGGVGLMASCDYVFATEKASVKLSELAIGIGPFVIEPTVSKKIGRTAMTEMTLEATEWKSAKWAFEKGLITKLFNSTDEMDEALNSFALQLSSYNPEALEEFKKVIWNGTEDWDHLLYERAAISGRLVLSEFTKNALLKFKKS